MNAYVIASRKSGIGDALPAIFPGCSVRTWRSTAAPKITGKLKEALAFVDAQLATGQQTITNRAIGDRIKVQRQNFGKLVTGRPEWAAEMQRRGLTTYKSPGRPGGVMVAQGEA